MSNTNNENIAEAQYNFNLALAAKNSRDYKTARKYLHKALLASPLSFADSGAWGVIFNSPAWFEQDEEAELYLEYAVGIMEEIKDLAKLVSIETISRLAQAFVNGVQFRHTTHNNIKLKRLMSHRADLYRLALTPFADTMNYSFSTPISKGGKIRYGVLLKHLRQDPETIGALSYFEYAKSEDIDVIVFVTSFDEQSGFAAHVRTVANEVIKLPDQLIESVRILREADLDFIFFANDVTAKPSLAAYLTFFRVARCAFTCVSTIATTCSPFVDAYIGGEYFYKRGLHTEFSEKFIPLPFPGFAFSVPVSTHINPQKLSRVAMNLPLNATVFASGANFTKLHDTLLRCWSRILQRCPNSYLILYPFPPHFGSAQKKYLDRWIGIFNESGIESSRIRVLDSLGSREAVVAMLKGVDIGLDSFPYSGLTTIVDAVEANLPIVVLSGPTLRNNHGAAIVESVRANELIANSVEEYVEIAVDLAHNIEKRSFIRQKLYEAMANTPNFLSPVDYCRSVVKACREIYQQLRLTGVISRHGKEKNDESR